MTVFDAQAIIALLLDEPAAGAVEDELRDPTRGSWISAINLAEIVDVMTRVFGQAPDEVRAALQLLDAGGLQVVPVDGDLGLEAGRLHARFYDRRLSPLSMADCVALASAMSLNEPLATSDPALAVAARAVGVVVLSLPDTHGRSPTT
ncbi:MAG: PIN domain-containing protein [Chloroflexi bacterium]|nr:PIN domain-containing protein [Chloroflexota bacterium]